MGDVAIISNLESPDVRMRKPVCGPELELVNRFVDLHMQSAKRRMRSSSEIVLVEPRFDSGYPDLVVVRYDPRKVLPWDARREMLSSQDRRLLSCLMKSRTLAEAELAESLGFSAAQVARSLERLSRCNLAVKANTGWRSAPRERFLSVRAVTAFEAKVGRAGDALLQAAKNKVFATASCVILGQCSVAAATRQRYELAGVGLLSGASLETVVARPRKQALPICNTAIMLNEWVSKYATLGVL